MPLDISGVSETLKAIRKFDPDLNKAMRREIKVSMLTIRDKARGLVPNDTQMLSNWIYNGSESQRARYRAFPKFDATDVKDGIIYRAGKNSSSLHGWKASFYVANTSAAGAIYETSGRVNPNGRPTQHVVMSRHRFNKKMRMSTTRHDNLSLNPNAGKQFNERLDAYSPLRGASTGADPRFGNTSMRGRLVFAAWDADENKANDAVLRAINFAVQRFNSPYQKNPYQMAA